MQKNNQTVLIANNESDVFYQLKNVNPLTVLGGCTAISELPEKSITIRGIPELSHIEKRERFIDFGSAVTLSQVLAVGKTNIPSVLYEAVKSIGTEPVRNLATIGGNICAPLQKHTLWAPLLALNASLEVKKSQTESKVIPFSKFAGVPEKHLLTKIRVPLDEWEVAVFRRVGSAHSIKNDSASFTFLVDTQKYIITNIRIAFAGIIVFHPQELENKLISTKLPLDRHSIENLVKDGETLYREQFKDMDIPPILEFQFLNLLRYSLELLT